MQHSNRLRAATLLLLVAALALGVAACSRGHTEEASEGYRDAKVEPVEGTDLSRVTLSQQAADRLGIQTTAVREQRVAVPGQPAAMHKVIPYAAVLYDESGDTWTFTSPQPLTYLRQPIKVDVIEGDMAVLSEGPAVGTTVVTVGAAELLGTELGVGEE
jgi:ABC-type oligopeptide transport system substrate-binding subunit